MILQFEKPEHICIVNGAGDIVRLNDQQRTWLKFDASDRAKARRICAQLNSDGARGPYRLIPLIGEPKLGGDSTPGSGFSS